jgi:hypothetical protein
MIPEPLTEFDRITSAVPMLSALRALWLEAEEELQASRPEGFTPEDIGRIAFDRLPEGELDPALDELFYTYWAATMADRETRARYEATGGAA